MGAVDATPPGPAASQGVSRDDVSTVFAYYMGKKASCEMSSYMEADGTNEWELLDTNQGRTETFQSFVLRSK